MIVVAGRAGSVDGLRLVRLVVEEVEVGGLLVQSGVGDGDADHSAGEFAKKKSLFLAGRKRQPAAGETITAYRWRIVTCKALTEAAGNVTVSSAPPADSCTLTTLSTSTA